MLFLFAKQVLKIDQIFYMFLIVHVSIHRRFMTILSLLERYHACKPNSNEQKKIIRLPIPKENCNDHAM